uniref:Uncharacterized protein n=1 Tax=Ixodes ricinus TaxID=34613 RepID=A0A6B0V0D3_IXORI
MGCLIQYIQNGRMLAGCPLLVGWLLVSPAGGRGSPVVAGLPRALLLGGLGGGGAVAVVVVVVLPVARRGRLVAGASVAAAARTLLGPVPVRGGPRTRPGRHAPLALVRAVPLGTALLAPLLRLGPDWRRGQSEAGLLVAPGRRSSTPEGGGGRRGRGAGARAVARRARPVAPPGDLLAAPAPRR